MSVVIQPAGSSASREHYLDTVESLVNISQYQELIGNTFLDLQRVSKNGKTALWGVTPGTNDANVSKYKKLVPGDLVVFTREKKVFASAQITHLFRNKKFAEELWGKDNKNQTWEYMYSLDNIEKLNLTYRELQKAIGSKTGDNFMGFRVLNSNKSQGVIELLGKSIHYKISSNEFRQNITFPYKVGDTFKRNELHEIVSGSFRQGMTSCLNDNAFLLFHDKQSGVEFGYDKWEGLQVDGSFAYTGQGIKGNQKLIRGNSALIKAHESGKPIHLIESNKGICEYLGEYALGDPYFEIKNALDISNNEREVFVFKLIPVSKLNFRINSISKNLVLTGKKSEWNAPNDSEIFSKGKVALDRNILRIEHGLQKRFGEFLLTKGQTVQKYQFKFENTKGQLEPDFWVNSMKLVVEAKASSAREYVRIGIGQVLDYANLSKINGTNFKPGLLLPNKPSHDLCKLIYTLGILLIIESESGFEFYEGLNNKTNVKFD
jgi:hypothetical protein